MRAAIFDIASFLIILTDMFLFIDADVLNRYPDGVCLQQMEQIYQDESFLQEGKAHHTQNPLFHTDETEQRLQEKNRLWGKGGDAAGLCKSFSLFSVIPFRETLIEESFLAFLNLVPIYLKVLFLRL